MKVLIMGSGAVGGYFGSVLAKSGQDVTFIARNEHLQRILADGLRVESDTAGTFMISPKASERPVDGYTADLVLFCVKAYHNEDAIEIIRPAIGDSTTILTLQNGIGGGDQLSEAFGNDKVLLGAAYIEAMRKSPGIIGQTGSAPRIAFGEADGTESDRAIEVRDALSKAGIVADLSGDVMKALWSKLVYISALSGMTCITRSEFVDVIETPETYEMTRRVVQETYDVAKAGGIDLDDSTVDDTLLEFKEGSHDMVSSMHLDLKAGNPLEVAVINGAVSKAGALVGVSTPLNDFIYTCLKPADNKARGL